MSESTGRKAYGIHLRFTDGAEDTFQKSELGYDTFSEMVSALEKEMVRFRKLQKERWYAIEVTATLKLPLQDKPQK